MFYSPILFSQIADVVLTHFQITDINVDELNKKDKIIIFALQSMRYFIKLVPYLDLINKPFVLISAMEDTQVPLEIDDVFMKKITSNKWCKHWFLINKTIPNDDFFTSIPYGLNYWTFSNNQSNEEYIQQNEELKNIVEHQLQFSKRIPKIYGNFHFNFNDDRHGGTRRRLLNIIPNNIIYYQPNYLPRTETWINMSNYSFVVSPFGHGFDCIRTFEALCLGCIVIMKKSFLDIIYEDLPILLVDEWTDIDENLLNSTIESFSKKTFNYEKLTMDYWINIVNSKW